MMIVSGPTIPSKWKIFREKSTEVAFFLYECVKETKKSQIYFSENVYPQQTSIKGPSKQKLCNCFFNKKYGINIDRTSVSHGSDTAKIKLASKT